MMVFLVAFVFGKFVWPSMKAASKQHKKLPPCVEPTESQSSSSRPESRTPDRSRIINDQPAENIRAAEAKMFHLLDTNEFTRALSSFRNFDKQGRLSGERWCSEELISSFIQSAIRIGNIDVVERFLHTLKHQGAEPTREFWQSTLRKLSSRKHFDMMLTAYAMFGSSLPADKVIFSCLINAALESAAPERAVAMLARYREADLEPKDYVPLFRTYVAVNDVAAAEKAFWELGSNMTSMMLNMVLLTCVRIKEPERALERLHDAWAFQEKRAKVAGNKAELPMVDVVSYNTVIKGFAQASLSSRCFDCLHAMRARNVEPDDVTFSTLLDMCINGNDMDSANQMADHLIRGDKPMDTVISTMFIKGLVRAQQLPKALELYDEMKGRTSEGTRPDIVTYSVLIKACVDSHNFERALLFLEDMATAKTQPDDIIFTHLIEGCGYAGKHALSQKLFNDMLAAGVKPSNYTLITMLKSHGRCGAHEDAYRLVADWESQHGLKPSVIHYTCLMSGCLRTRHYEGAWRAYELMLKMNVRPDEQTFSTLLPGMVAAQHWERVLLLARSALKPPSTAIAPETLNSALSQMRAAVGQAHFAEQLQTLMQGANIKPSARNVRKSPHDERITANAPWQRAQVR